MVARFPSETKEQEPDNRLTNKQILKLGQHYIQDVAKELVG